MSFESARILGLLGAVFLIVSPFGSGIGSVLGLVGLVLLLIAFHELADHYRDRDIFSNALYGIIIFIVGAIITAAIVGIAAAGALTQIGLSMSSWTDPVAWQSIDWNGLNYDALAPYFAAMALALVVLFAMTVVAAWFIRNSLKSLALRSNVHMFATTGLVLLIGAVLTIIGIGFILLWVAMILLAIAFYRLKAAEPVVQYASPGPQTGGSEPPR